MYLYNQEILVCEYDIYLLKRLTREGGTGRTYSSNNVFLHMQVIYNTLCLLLIY